MPEATKTNSNKDNKPREFNPRWKGYVYIIITSLVNFASISNLETYDDDYFRGNHRFSLSFGILTFMLALIILTMDRFQYCCNESMDKFNYTKALDGKIEGYTLLFFTFWWIVGTAHITQVDGVAYLANNIYFSAWLALVACVYTLDRWSAAKDILSIQELTGLSATLKSWYLLFLASLVTFGTSCDLHIQVESDNFKSEASYGIALGLFSSLIALFFILVHYRLVDFEFLQVGGWIELSASFFMILVWIIGVALLTQEGSIAATIGGSGCSKKVANVDGNVLDENCWVIWTPNPMLDENKENSDGEGSGTATDTDAPSVYTSADSSLSNNSTGAPYISTQPTSFPTNSGGNRTEATETMVSNNSSLSPTPTVAPTNASLNSQSSVPTFADNTTTLAPSMFPSDLIGVDDNEDDSTPVANSSSAAESTQNLRFLQDFVDNTTTSFNVTYAENLTTASIAPSQPATTTRPTPPLFAPTVAPSFPPINSSAANYIVYERRVSCGDVLEQQLPGSNLYLAVWACFFASFNITLRWKAAQALQFAQAQNRKAARLRGGKGRRSDDDIDNDDAQDDEDDDERDPGNSIRSGEGGL